MHAFTNLFMHYMQLTFILLLENKQRFSTGGVHAVYVWNVNLRSDNAW